MSTYPCEEPADKPDQVAPRGRVLIVDDEGTFREATADLLRDEGYWCDCASDGTEALRMLGVAHYDLLVADIRMPGNPNLELVKAVQQAVEWLPVILVTGYPSLGSAIDSVRLPVVAYLVKPIEFSELSSLVETWVRRSATFRVICDARKRLADWYLGLEEIERTLASPRNQAGTGSLRSFVTLTCRGIVGALSELCRLTESLAEVHDEPEQAWICASARAQTTVALLEEVVEVLKRSKNAFKSKALGELRHKLQVVIDQWKSDEAGSNAPSISHRMENSISS